MNAYACLLSAYSWERREKMSERTSSYLVKLAQAPSRKNLKESFLTEKLDPITNSTLFSIARPEPLHPLHFYFFPFPKALQKQKCKNAKINRDI